MGLRMPFAPIHAGPLTPMRASRLLIRPLLGLRMNDQSRPHRTPGMT